MNPTVMGSPRLRKGDYDIVPYQSTHNTGGTVMGNDPGFYLGLRISDVILQVGVVPGDESRHREDCGP